MLMGFSPALFGSQEEARRDHETRLAAARAVPEN
jgi:hypothetical protein